MIVKQIEQFVESWGSMGMLWGVNRSIARVHALLIVSEGSLSLEEIAERLQMSRGNASMSLKELRAWGVIRRVHRPGDRRDYYESEPDVWRMFFQIFTERKRREFDPLLSALQELLAQMDGNEESDVQHRLTQMAELLGMMDQIMNHLLVDERTTRTMLRFLSGMSPKP